MEELNIKNTNNEQRIKYHFKFLTESNLRGLGIDSIWDLPHCNEGEGGESMGIRGRKGVGGLSFYTELIKLKDGTFKRRDRIDLTGKKPEELGYIG